MFAPFRSAAAKPIRAPRSSGRRALPDSHISGGPGSLVLLVALALFRRPGSGLGRRTRARKSVQAETRCVYPIARPAGGSFPKHGSCIAHPGMPHAVPPSRFVPLRSAFPAAGANRKAGRPRGRRFLPPAPYRPSCTIPAGISPRSSLLQELFQIIYTGPLRFEDGEAADADPIGYHRRTGGADRERHCERLRGADAEPVAPTAISAAPWTASTADSLRL